MKYEALSAEPYPSVDFFSVFLSRMYSVGCGLERAYVSDMLY